MDTYFFVGAQSSLLVFCVTMWLAFKEKRLRNPVFFIAAIAALFVLATVDTPSLARAVLVCAAALLSGSAALLLTGGAKTLFSRGLWRVSLAALAASTLCFVTFALFGFAFIRVAGMVIAIAESMMFLVLAWRSAMDSMVPAQTPEVEFSRRIQDIRTTASPRSPVANREHGLLVHEAFAQVLHDEFQRASRYGGHVSLLAVALDNLDALPDDPTGASKSKFIDHFARSLPGQLRQSDSCSYMGDGKFCVVLPETPVERAMLVAEKIRASFAKQVFVWEAWGLSCSAGVSCCREAQTQPDLVYAEADAALERAQAAGGNRAAMHPGLI